MLNSEGLQTLLDCKRKPSLGEKNAHNFPGREQLICQGTAYSPERASRGCHPALWWPEMRSNLPTLVPSLLLARALCGSWAAFFQWSFNNKWGILRVFWGGLSLKNAFVSLWLFFDKAVGICCCEAGFDMEIQTTDTERKWDSGEQAENQLCWNLSLTPLNFPLKSTASTSNCT